MSTGSFIAAAVSIASQSGVLAPLTRATGQAANRGSPNNIYSPEVYITAWHKNLISTDWLKRFVESSGYFVGNIDLAWLSRRARNNEGIWDVTFQNPAGGITAEQNMILAERYTPTVDEALDLYQRGFITNRLCRDMLRLNKIFQPNEQSLYMRASKPLPGISDLIRFSVRGAFSQDEITTYGYHNETPEAILPFTKELGYNWPIGMTKPEGIGEDGNVQASRDAYWFDLYWWSHWELPSLTQGYDMMYRLYPDSRFGPSPDYTVETSFTNEDMEKLQKAQDIPTYWRKRLQAIAYMPLTRTDAKRMNFIGVLNRRGLYHAFRANGYNDRNALNLVRFTEEENRRMRMRLPGRLTRDQICNWFKLGTITREQAITNLRSLDIPEAEAAFMMDLCEADLAHETAKEAIKYIRRRYMRGEISADRAREQLTNYGIRPTRVQQYIDTWFLNLRSTTHLLSASKNIAHYKKGLIDENLLTSLLQQLGYSSRAVGIMVREAKLELQEKRARQIQTIGEKQTKAIKATIKERQSAAEKQARELQKRLDKALSGASEKNLVEWYKAGLITINQIRKKLIQKGWMREDVERFVRSKFGKKEESEGENGIPQEKEESR